MKSFLALVQARMGSSRLPGKSLRLLGGIPMLGHLLDGLESVFPRDRIRVLSSENAENAPLHSYLSSRGISCFRGSENNVAARFEALLTAERPDFFLRMSGDSPFLDPRIAVAVKNAFSGRDPDLVSTVLNGTLPSGMNVEGLKTSFFLEGFPKFSSTDHFEHVTRYFYEAPRANNGEAVPGFTDPLKAFKFSVDTEADFQLMEKFHSRLTRPHFEYTLQEKCALLGELIKEANR